MTINITPEIEDAYRQFLAEQVDSFVGGQPIYRRDTAPYSTMRFSGLVDFAAGHQAARAALAAVQPVRMLTAQEIDRIADRCDGLGDQTYERELFDEFARINGLTMKGDKHG